MLPNTPGKPIEILVPSALQMGWTLSPPFFCAAAETARDVAQTYVAEAVGSLPEHPPEDLTMPEIVALPAAASLTGAQSEMFVQLLESFVDDFMHLVQSTDPEVLRHCSRALLHGIHSVFPPPKITGHSGADPVSVKKLENGKGILVGWMIDGATCCIELTEKNKPPSSSNSSQYSDCAECHSKECKSWLENYGMHPSASQLENIYLDPSTNSWQWNPSLSFGNEAQRPGWHSKTGQH